MRTVCLGTRSPVRHQEARTRADQVARTRGRGSSHRARGGTPMDRGGTRARAQQGTTWNSIARWYPPTHPTLADMEFHHGMERKSWNSTGLTWSSIVARMEFHRRWSETHEASVPKVRRGQGHLRVPEGVRCSGVLGLCWGRGTLEARSAWYGEHGWTKAARQASPTGCGLFSGCVGLGSNRGRYEVSSWGSFRNARQAPGMEGCSGPRAAAVEEGAP